ncbi:MULTISPECIES: metallophosphoesterase [Microbacterium]|uniref:Metallophosphoesterase n=2 Tax=Microbacterium maritypicum TaxID=33918 RepID=A0ACD4B463_MICMQ|nr:MULTISPECIES: metallophosphoesterase [Microbacterium]EYT61567.1 metallophosphatase [Microbacterium sp. UCD-TDU]MBP5803779.1 metallophosphoesterase [Microbacterium liquefaciens]UTT52166.1 metallophosphoesterase [Microbacterium liquefaciens]WEF20206.1 metallophosphoesterase [Microbacterium liquefaciens]
MPVVARRAAHPALVALGAVGAVGAAAAIWGIGIERYLFTVREATAKALPSGSAPLRILHISDAHMAPWQHRKQDWLASLAELKPDLIVNTGDNLGHENGLEGIRRAFAPLAGIPGVFVHGSNDVAAPSPRNPFRYFLGPSKKHHKPELLDTDAMDRYFTDELGWTDLNNAAARLRIAGAEVDLFGVNDAHRDWDRLDELPDAIAALGARAATTPVLGVTHAPYQRVLNGFTDLGADAILGGHTHGGQVCLPGFGALVANCDIPLKQAKGLSTWSHGDRTVPLNVSAGCGHSIYAPVRFACRPEATLLTLTARD